MPIASVDAGTVQAGSARLRLPAFIFREHPLYVIGLRTRRFGGQYVSDSVGQIRSGDGFLVAFSGVSSPSSANVMTSSSGTSSKHPQPAQNTAAVGRVFWFVARISSTMSTDPTSAVEPLAARPSPVSAFPK